MHRCGYQKSVVEKTFYIILKITFVKNRVIILIQELRFYVPSFTVVL